MDVRRVSPFEISENSKFLWLSHLGIATVLDVGANVGQFARQIHSVLPDASIYSFEPLSDCFAELVSNMKHVPNFHAYNFALGDKDCEARIHKNKYRPATSILPMEDSCKEAYPFTGEESEEAIKIRRLDDLASGLDGHGGLLIKIDVQGYEDKVIRGGWSTIGRAKVLLIETAFKRLYKGQPLFEDIQGMLKQIGYSYAGSLEQYPNPVDGSPLQEDSIFVNSASPGANP